MHITDTASISELIEAASHYAAIDNMPYAIVDDSGLAVVPLSMAHAKKLRTIEICNPIGNKTSIF